MQLMDKATMPYKVNAKVIPPPKASGVPISHNHDHAKYDYGNVVKAKANKPSIKITAKLMMFLIEPHLVEKFKCLLAIRSNCACFNIPIIVLN